MKFSFDINIILYKIVFNGFREAGIADHVGFTFDSVTDNQ